MTVKRIVGSDKFIGVTGEEPTDGATTVRPGATFYDWETGIMYITYDGATWVEKPTIVQLETSPSIDIGDVTLLANDGVDIGDVDVASITAGTNVIGKVGLVESDGATDAVGEVDSSPTANTILGRLKDIDDALSALGYEFTINGVNFNGHANIKSLMLLGNAEDDDPITLRDAGAGDGYQVPTDHIFIAFQALVWLEQIAMVGRIGESDAADEAISKEVLKLGNGTQVPFITPCYGVFTAGKYITAESDSANDNYTIKAGSTLYGAEIDIS